MCARQEHYDKRISKMEKTISENKTKMQAMCIELAKTKQAMIRMRKEFAETRKKVQLTILQQRVQSFPSILIFAPHPSPSLPPSSSPFLQATHLVLPAHSTCGGL